VCHMVCEDPPGVVSFNHFEMTSVHFVGPKTPRRIPHVCRLRYSIPATSVGTGAVRPVHHRSAQAASLVMYKRALTAMRAGSIVRLVRHRTVARARL